MKEFTPYTDKEMKVLTIKRLERDIKEWKSMVRYWHNKIDTCAPEWKQTYIDKFTGGKQHLYHLLRAHKQITECNARDIREQPLFVSNY